MKIIRRIYSIYIYIVFVVLALVVLPVILLFSINPELHKTALKINRYWAKVFFILILNPIRVDYRFTLRKEERYIFCANHFSYIDIPVIGRLKMPFKYIGKMSVSKVPLFGLMFRRLHVMVDRESLRSRASSLIQCRQALKNGYNMVIFPEGGILTQNPPALARFKDGAFRLSVEEQVPVVPVVMPNNYLILPDDGKLLFNWKPTVMVVLPPIYPETFQNDPDLLKNEVFRVISEELGKYHPEKVTSVS